jgi:hypothetical protein
VADESVFVVDQNLLGKARRYKSELLARMFAVGSSAARADPLVSVLPAGSNVVGVGFGAKVTAGAGVSDGPAVRVYVRAKVAASSLSRSESVPQEVNGLPTDVVPVGDVTALGKALAVRPTPCGVSVGHHAITAGTLGCLVRRRGSEDGDRFILSNNHVLANSNEGKAGDAVLQPGPIDGGDPSDLIAELTDFEPVDFSGPNAMDAAIAKVLDREDVEPEILGIGRVRQPPIPAALYQSVRKHGRTTLHTVGIVMDLAADINVRFGTRVASFEDQLAVSGVGGEFSSGGDSGSLVVDAVTRRPVALLFAGGLGTTFANPIGPVLDRFGAEIL